MPSLPDQPDLAHLRRRAKELKRGVVAGEQAGIDRVLAFHPKYAGGPAGRLNHQHLSLPDAQVTIARELGFESWKALVMAVEEATEERRSLRWEPNRGQRIGARAMTKAHQLGHSACSLPHFLLALLDPPEPSPAFDVLTELGASFEEARARFERWGTPRREGDGTTSAPGFHAVMGWAAGLAVASGASEVADEHVLLALAYGVFGGDTAQVGLLGLDPDEVYEGLARRGVKVPTVRPPIPATPSGPWGPHVYFPASELSGVTSAVAERFPIGSLKWGFNTSIWKPGYLYVVGEDEIPMEEIVRGAVDDPSTV